MKTKSIIFVGLIAVSLMSFFPYNKNSDGIRPEKNYNASVKKVKWVSLFNGKNFEGWRSLAYDSPPKRGWKIENGALIVNFSGGRESKNGGALITQKKYADFELKWEWKMMTKGGNSGLKYYVNSSSKNNKMHGIGLEYQILDDAFHPWMLQGKMKPGDYYTLGAAYNLYAPGTDKKVKPIGKWNKSKIVCRNGSVEHWLNGKKLIQFDRFSEDFDSRVAKSKFKNMKDYGKHVSGHILLQDHGDNVHFRNIMIKEY